MPEDGRAGHMVTLLQFMSESEIYVHGEYIFLGMVGEVLRIPIYRVCKPINHSPHHKGCWLQRTVRKLLERIKVVKVALATLLSQFMLLFLCDQNHPVSYQS